jgi:hypothetical protein
VGAAGSDVGEAERARAGAHEGRAGGEHALDHRGVAAHRAARRPAELDHRLLDVRVGNAHGPIVEERAPPEARAVKLAVHGRRDGAERELAAGHEGDRHAEVRNAVGEIRGAVDRVDHP